MHKYVSWGFRTAKYWGWNLITIMFQEKSSTLDFMKFKGLPRIKYQV